MRPTITRATPRLLPASIARTLPPLYAQDGAEDPIAHVRLFSPWSGWSWYLTEYDPARQEAFGLVIGHERELGYFSIAELEQAQLAGRGNFRLPLVERDCHWTPRPLSEVD